MSDIKLSKLMRVPLRDVWRHEALDFTQWLALPENIEHLSEVVGVELLETQAEVGVGSGQFHVDIVAIDQNGRRVVIENQLEQTNHDHLGKLITYASGLEAEVVIWIVADARQEHEQAINWLNEHTTEKANFFLIQIEAWRIGDSDPAPRFNVVAKPNDWAKVVKQSAAGSVSDTNLQQLDFWERVRDYGSTDAPTIKRWQTPRPQHWYDISVGSSQCHIGLTVNSVKKQGAVELYIPDNKELFAKLATNRESIESALGLSLEWMELPRKKASRIVVRHDGDFLDPEQSQELLVWLVETANTFSRVFPQYF